MKRCHWYIGGILMGMTTWLAAGCDSSSSPNTGGPPLDGQTAQCSDNSTCGPKEVCKDKACQGFPGLTYRFGVTTAVASTKNYANETYDPQGGLPDIKVCLYLSQTELGCTPVVQDSTQATWTWTVDAQVQGDDTFHFELVDVDPTLDEVIVYKEYSDIAAVLHAGGDTATWSAGKKSWDAMAVTWTVTAL